MSEIWAFAEGKLPVHLTLPVPSVSCLIVLAPFLYHGVISQLEVS